MEVSELRQLRHDLRTPVNHIVGYAELALEAAVDDADADAQEPLRRIVALGHGLTKLIDHRLPKSLQDADAARVLPGLHESLRPSLEQIKIIADFPCLQGPAYKADVQRICTAAGRLLGEHPPDEEPLEAAAAQPRGDQGHILVADDDAVNRDVLRRMLSGEGFEISLACDGAEAWNMVEARAFDLVLLDMMMPGMTGIEVLRSIKKKRETREIPVIMISGLDEVSLVVQTIEAGAEDYLPKPFEPAILRARIGASLSKRKLRQQMAAQEKLASLGALAAGVAHEIRNPLNFILNFSEISKEMLEDLEQSPPGSADAIDLAKDLSSNLQRIREHALRADQIVRGMLQHSRAGGSEKELLEVNRLVAESVHLAHSGAKNSAAVQLKMSLAPDAGMIKACAGDLGRVFLNLASNALYSAARGANGLVEVSTRRDGRWVEVRVRDNGAGIPEPIRQKIFQPFFTTKPPGEGTGLGLSIAFDIVVGGHDGDLTVDSEEQKYAEFRVRLPGE